MHLLVVGISHQTADVAVREKIAMNQQQVVAFLQMLRDTYANAEFTLLSTCNRTELYMSRALHGHPRLDEIIAHFASASSLTPDQLTASIYHRENEKAVDHLFRVCSGIESMVLGENQIIGQIRQAYELAQQTKTIGTVLHQLFQTALQVGKKVRNETGIGEGRMSVSRVAVDFAAQLFDSLHDKTLLTIGAGQMAELTLQSFLDQKIKRIIVCNRSKENGTDLVNRFGGQYTPFESLEQSLIDADIVISSTGAREHIVTRKMIKSLMPRRRFRPLFIVDIAMPRDFQPEIDEIDGVYLYNLDHLHSVLEDHADARKSEVDRCLEMIQQAVKTCYAEIQQADFSELIQLLRTQMHDIGQLESARLVNKVIQTDDPAQVEQILNELTHRLVNKILHRPFGELKRQRPAAAAMYATALRRLFALDGELENLDEPEPNVIKQFSESEKSELP